MDDWRRKPDAGVAPRPRHPIQASIIDSRIKTDKSRKITMSDLHAKITSLEQAISSQGNYVPSSVADALKAVKAEAGMEVEKPAVEPEPVAEDAGTSVGAMGQAQPVVTDDFGAVAPAADASSAADTPVRGKRS